MGTNYAVAIATYESCINTFDFILEQVDDITIRDVFDTF